LGERESEMKCETMNAGVVGLKTPGKTSYGKDAGGKIHHRGRKKK